MSERMELTYRCVTGELARTWATVGEEFPAAGLLLARQVFLEDRTELRQVFPQPGSGSAGFDQLDNEILAGLRLAWLVLRGRGAVTYPPQVSCLRGYEPDSAEPFALLEPYRGETVREVGRRLLPADQDQFQVSLLEGMRWLGVAGVAHRGISPGTVRWDRATRQAQITSFGDATVLGVPRTPAGTSFWAGPEQRAHRVHGEVGATDDVWGAGQVIAYVLTGEPVSGREQIDGIDDPNGLLRAALTGPDGRATVLGLLRRLGAPDPVPRELTADPLQAGRDRFYAARGGGPGAPHQPGSAGRAATPPSAQAGSSVPGGKSRANASWPHPRARALGGLLIVLALVGLVVGLLR